MSFLSLYFQEPFLTMRRKTYEYHSKCCDNYIELLGDIKKYGLHPILDWGDTYITDMNGTRITHIDNDGHIMLFNLTKAINKKYDNIMVENVFSDDLFGQVIRLENLTPKELKEKLIELYGF